MNQPNQQHNRYLESPFAIRDTSPKGQFAFGTVRDFGGGILFKKDSFLVSLSDIEQGLVKEKEECKEIDDVVKEFD